MDLEYILDSNSDEPIILIHGDIGYPEGTMGDRFTKQLMYLDTLGKKRIQVWINSGGGVVTDGEQICNAILQSKTPVDTFNTGTCASVAYPIFACGRIRTMMDFAKNMFHNPFGGDEKSLEAFKKTLIKIIVSRSNGKLSLELMSGIMDRETWIMAEESLALGLCDKIELCEAYNKAEFIKNLDTKIVKREQYGKVLNQIIEDKFNTQNTMDKVTNKLNLVKGSNEDAISNAIDAIVNQAKFDKAEFEKCKSEFEEKEKNYIETKAKFDAMKIEHDRFVSDRVAAENKAKELSARALVAENVKLGKVENKAEKIEAMEKAAIANFEGTKAILDAITSTVATADIENHAGQGVKQGLNVMDINNSMSKDFRTKRGQ